MQKNDGAERSAEPGVAERERSGERRLQDWAGAWSGFFGRSAPLTCSGRDWRDIVKTTKIATWVTVFGSLFLNYKCVRSCYGFSPGVL